jgi:hypothetical protein
VLQCGANENYTITRTFNSGVYDTIDDDQFARRGSRQLNQWTFDTLFLYLGADAQGNPSPNWVPFPRKEAKPGPLPMVGGIGGGYPSTGVQYERPEWYVGQLRDIFVAGSPFKYVASFPDGSIIQDTHATILSFNEEYRHGEADAIWFTAFTFQEWRDPRGKTQLPKPKWPAHCKCRVGEPYKRFLYYDVTTPHKYIPTKGKVAAGQPGTTLHDLAKHFYGNAALWKTIAKANKLKGGTGDTPIHRKWYPKKIHNGVPTETITIPKKPA